MEEKNPSGSSFDRGCLAACILFGCAAALNIVFLFLSPSEVIIPFTDHLMSSLLLAIAGMGVVGLAGVMSVFSPHRKYWLIAESLLTLADVLLVASYFIID